MRAAGWGLVLLVTGCFNRHVEIPTPPPDLTPEQRLIAFEQYREGGRGVEWTTTCGRHGCTTTSRNLLLLRNGSEIRYAEDLLPVLSPKTPAYRAAVTAQHARRRVRQFQLFALGGFLGGIGLVVLAVKAESLPIGYTGAVIMIGAPIAGVTGWIVNIVRGSVATNVVFETYDQSLAETLQICSQGLAVVPCDGSAPGSPQPAMPDPALRSLRQR